VPPPKTRQTWFTKLAPELQRELLELRAMWHRDELVTDTPISRRWTIAEVTRFVREHTDIEVTDNQFRPWFTQGNN